MDAIFNAVNMSGISADARAALMAVLVIALIAGAVYYVTRLIFPAAGGSDD